MKISELLFEARIANEQEVLTYLKSLLGTNNQEAIKLLYRLIAKEDKYLTKPTKEYIKTDIEVSTNDI